MGGQVSICGARVGELGGAAGAGGREFVGAEEGEARAPGVEGGVDVEETVALGTEYISARMSIGATNDSHACVFFGDSAVCPFFVDTFHRGSIIKSIQVKKAIIKKDRK